MDRRSSTREPIRLRVTYKSVRALVSEYTSSISRGGCTVQAAGPVAEGTAFIFELSTEQKSTKVIEVEGSVIHSTPRNDGKFDIGIAYASVSTPRRVAMTRFLDEVFSEQLAKRKHARVPVNLVAQDLDQGELKYLVRDLSRGGMGLRLPTERGLPVYLQRDQRAEVYIYYEGELPFIVPSRIVRLEAASPPAKHASIGLQFEELSEANMRVVDALLYLHRPNGLFVRFLG